MLGLNGVLSLSSNKVKPAEPVVFPMTWIPVPFQVIETLAPSSAVMCCVTAVPGVLGEEEGSQPEERSEPLFCSEEDKGGL